MFNDLSHDDLTGFRTVQMFLGDEDVVDEVLALGNHIGNAPFLIKTANQAPGFSFQNFNQASLATPPLIDSADADYGPIIVHQCPHFLGGQIKITSAGIWAQEPKTVGMRDNAPGDQVGMIDDTVSIPAILMELAIPFHCPEPSSQRLNIFFAVQPQNGRQFVELFRRALFVDNLQDQFPARNRADIFSGFPFRKRILQF